MKISYGLTVCDEHKELKNLIEYLLPKIDKEDEIVIVYDQNRITDEVKEIINQYSDFVFAYPFDFRQNFLENKNYLGSKCTGDYIFQIDADEIPEEFLVRNLKAILEHNPVDLLITPRKNLVLGLTQEYIIKWGWRVTEQGWVNWPDCQKRIYKNDPSIQWTGHQVHGMVEGYKNYIELPLEERWSIIHNKTIDRQEKQNERYTKIDLKQL
jgi:hypothetical protein